MQIIKSNLINHEQKNLSANLSDGSKKPSVLDQKIKDFLYSIPEFLEDFSYISNCTSLNDLEYIFLGDIHNNKKCKNLNTKILQSLTTSKSLIYVEGSDPEFIFTTASQMLEVEKLASDIVYRGWDCDSMHVDIATRNFFYFIKKIVLYIEDLQNIISGNNNLTLEEFHEYLNKLYNECPVNVKEWIDTSIPIPSWALTKMGQTKEDAIAKMILIGSGIIRKFVDATNGSFDSRQHHMTDILRRVNNVSGPIFSVGGSHHFYKNDAIDPILGAFISAHNYLIIYPSFPLNLETITNSEKLDKSYESSEDFCSEMTNIHLFTLYCNKFREIIESELPAEIAQSFTALFDKVGDA